MSEEYVVPASRVDDMKRILAIVAKGGGEYFRRPVKIVVISGRDESRFVLEFDKEMLVPVHGVLQGAVAGLRRQICTELIRAVAFLHAAQIFHRHLTSDDVLLTADGHVRVTNFFQSVSQNDSAAVYVCGRNYRPPEIIVGVECDNSAAIDAWSLGCLLFEICTGHGLFVLVSSKDAAGCVSPALRREQLTQIVECLGTPLDEDISERYAPAARKALLSMKEGCRNLQTRLDEARVEHAELWCGVIRGLLHFLPSKRTSVVDLLQHPLFATAA